VSDMRALLVHFLAALAYRTQKALRDAPETFADFRVRPGVRTPHELVLHMSGVLGYARTFFEGGEWHPAKLSSFSDEVVRFHEILKSFRKLLQSECPPQAISCEQLLQGPMADAMTHVGQLALLRRLYGNPVPPENFVYADISADNVGQNQPRPVSPDEEWVEPE